MDPRKLKRDHDEAQRALADLLLVIRNAAVPGWLQTVSAVVLTAIMCLYSVLVLGVDWEV